MTDQKTVNPVLPGGFRDYGPADMIYRSEVISKIRSVFERFGFDPLETPGMELKRTLTGGNDELRQNIYLTQNSGALAKPEASKVNITPEAAAAKEAAAKESETAMRFDLTVPLARFVAANYDKLNFPFKRYQYGNVWRGEKPAAGRFREFAQLDADIVGSANPLADAEIVALMVESMRAIGLERFEVRYNHRKILNGLAELAGFDQAMMHDVLRIIDKLPKIGRDAVLRELSKTSITENAGPSGEGNDQAEADGGAGLSEKAVERIAAFLDLAGSTEELLEQVGQLFAGIKVAEDGLEDMRVMTKSLRAMGVPETNWRFDISIARGLSYYTGPVFETFLLDQPRLGSIFSGGRYDDLVTRFTPMTLPATGASVGIDRLFSALAKLGMVKTAPTLTQVLVTVIDPSLQGECLAITGELRSAGIRAALWLGQDSKFRGQMGFASNQQIPIVVILGADEQAASNVSVKDMRTREQHKVARVDLLALVKKLLS